MSVLSAIETTTPILYRTSHKNGQTYLAATVRIIFGPRTHDSRAVHAGVMLKPGEDVDSPMIRAALRKDLAGQVARCIVSDEWSA